MNILILTPRFPFPENGGDVLRINGIAKYLKKNGNRLILVSFTEGYNIDFTEANKIYDSIYTVKRKPWLSAINALWYLINRKPIQCGYYYSRDYLNKIKEITTIEKPDLYICHLLRTVPYIHALGLEDKTIIEMTDALSKTYSIAQNAKGLSIKKCIYKIEYSLIKKYEIQIIREFRKVVLVSKGDIDYLSQLLNEKHYSLSFHTNGVEISGTIPSNYNNRKICFVGNMRTLQNQEAVLHFVNDIFPLILEKRPDTIFHIVGAQPSEKIKSLASNNIVVTGFVEDICEYISDSCVAVAPVHIAAGIQNKVLVSMGCGIPVIMSSLISKPIPELRNNINCYIEDDAEKIADLCIMLMNNKEIRNTVGLKGREMIIDNYSWDSTLSGYETI